MLCAGVCLLLSERVIAFDEGLFSSQWCCFSVARKSDVRYCGAAAAVLYYRLRK
jgi:hypothetical protein